MDQGTDRSGGPVRRAGGTVVGRGDDQSRTRQAPVRRIRTSPAWAKLRTRLPVFAVLLVIVALTGLTAATMDSGRFSPDGEENIRLSFYLWTAGSFSEDGREPSYLREPLGIFVTAAHMALLTDIPESATTEKLIRDSHYRKQILWVNLYYLVGLLLAVWWLSWLLTRSHVVGALAIIGTGLFSTVQYHSGNLLTESLAALTLALACASMVWLVQTKRLRAAVLAGVMLGVLALTKAAALYVALVAIPVLAVSTDLFGLLPRRAALTVLAVTALSFAITVTPWMTRNYLQFGDFAIAQRGGVVLYTRALKDNMSREEYWGTFYAYAPVPLRKHVFESLLGFRAQDLKPGGRYGRLVRYPPGEPQVVMAGDVEDAVSYFGKAWAMKVRLSKQMAAAGLPQSEVDRVLQERAMDMIKAAPGRHLATTVPFAWRGLWSFAGDTLLGVGANLVAFVTLLAFPFIAIWRRRAEWFAFSLLAVGMFWFHALFTHFIPRYSEPLVPLAVLSVLVLVHALFVRLKERRSSTRI